MTEIKNCKTCTAAFEVTDTDLTFYKTLGVPPPTLCPEERERRRLVWRNERFLYKRTCGLCNKAIIAIYPPECTFPIYCETCFWSDAWNPTDPRFREGGRAYNPQRSFFEQLEELQNKVPRLAITHTKSQNSDYTLNSVENKNCYLTSGADYNEDCLYGINSQRSRDCVDTYLVYDSELSYGCTDSARMFNAIGCQESEQCSYSWFLYDCKSCANCAFSSNLRHKQYVLCNEQLSKEEYEKRLPHILNELFKDANWVQKGMQQAKAKAIHHANLIINSENVSGNYIRNCKNSYYVFDAENLEDCKYIYYGLHGKDCYDMCAVGFECSLLYEIMSATNCYNCAFSNALFFCSDVQYSIGCFSAKNLFGCISMQSRQLYCILNTQYSREDYHQLREKIIEDMKIRNEYGEYFPPQMAPFEYNRSAAIDYMPLSRSEALAKGFRWHDEQNATPQAAAYSKEILQCTRCKNNYRLIQQEIDFYKRIQIPVPRLCWACRLSDLIHERKPRALYTRKCSQCAGKIQTPYASERPEKIYCDTCYLASLM